MGKLLFPRRIGGQENALEGFAKEEIDLRPNGVTGKSGNIGERDLPLFIHIT